MLSYPLHAGSKSTASFSTSHSWNPRSICATSNHRPASSCNDPEALAITRDGRDVLWDILLEADPVDCVPLLATDPPISCTLPAPAGKPKGVVRDNGGHLVALTWTMKNIYNVHPGEVYWAASDIGWVVGHSYIVYGPLFYGCTTILYEGKSVGTPDTGAFWRVIEEHGVSVLFCAPTAFRAIRKEDPEGEKIRAYDLKKLRMLFLAGERCDPDTLIWAQQQLKIPVIDHWWQTETGWAIGANCVGLELLPVKPGPCKVGPGIRYPCTDAQGGDVPAGESGNVVVRLPLPPGCFMTLWQNDLDFVKIFFSISRVLPDL